MKKQMFPPNKKIVKIWFAIILIETLQINKAVIATSQVTISSDTKTSNSGIIYNKPVMKLIFMDQCILFSFVKL